MHEPSREGPRWRARIGAAFGSLERSRNFRLWSAGNLVSTLGDHCHTLAIGWLMVQLTGSAFAVGAAIALRYLPRIWLGPWAGVLADRVPVRRILVACLTALAVNTLCFWGFTARELITTTLVYLLAGTHGVVDAVWSPARNAFVRQLVERELRWSAIGINSVVNALGRAGGPALGGVLIAALGIAPAFLINAGTFAVFLVALAMLRRGALGQVERAARERALSQVVDGFRYVLATPALWIPLAAMAIVANVTNGYAAVFPLLASDTWRGTVGTFAWLLVFHAVGRAVGGLISASRTAFGLRALAVDAGAAGVALAIAAVAPALWMQLGLLFVFGVFGAMFGSGVQALVEQTASDSLRGRVSAIWSMVTAPMATPLVGAIADATDPRFGLGVGGLAAIVVAIGIRIGRART